MPEFWRGLLKFDGHLISGRNFMGFSRHSACYAVSSMRMLQRESIVDREWQGADKQRTMIVHVGSKCLNHLFIPLHSCEQPNANAQCNPLAPSSLVMWSGLRLLIRAGFFQVHPIVERLNCLFRSEGKSTAEISVIKSPCPRSPFAAEPVPRPAPSLPSAFSPATQPLPAWIVWSPNL